MSNGNGSTLCNCASCEEHVCTKGVCVDVFWFSGDERNGFVVHHEREVHVVVRDGRVVAIKEQSEYTREQFIAIVDHDCAKGLQTQSFPFNTTHGRMTRNDAVMSMRKAVRNAVRSTEVKVVRGRKRAKKVTAAA